MRIYVAGPMTSSGREMVQNIRDAISCSDWLIRLGHAPYVPQLTHFWNLMSTHTWEEWLRLDEAWLMQCECLVRLPGESEGADREVAFCREHGIPVYLGMEARRKELEPEVGV